MPAHATRPPGHFQVTGGPTSPEAAARRGETAIGYRIHTDFYRPPSYGVVLNPPKHRQLTPTEQDRHRPVIRRTNTRYGWHRGDMLIRLYDENREVLRPLFRLADDSEQEIDRYAGLGDVLVAEDNGELVGQLQLTATAEPSTFELKSMAVIDGRRGGGIGRALVEEAIALCRARGATHLLVATAAADIDNLRFYQRRGFRMLSIERDAFTAAAGYPDGIVIDGIPLRDRVWLDQDLAL